MSRGHFSATVALVLFCACASSSGDAAKVVYLPTSDPCKANNETSLAGKAQRQRMSVVTFNVHAMLVVDYDPATINLPILSEKLREKPRSLVLLQELFDCQAVGGFFRPDSQIYPDQSALIDACVRLQQNPIGRFVELVRRLFVDLHTPIAGGDGLGELSQWKGAPVMTSRTPWSHCSGNYSRRHRMDCLTSKGFTFTHRQLDPSRCLDTYNAHFDSGQHPNDQQARTLQVQQLIAAVRQRSLTPGLGCAVVVGGDFNMKPKPPVSRDSEDSDSRSLATLLDELQLEDPCHKVVGGPADPYPGYLLDDRVLFRNGAAGNLQLDAVHCDIARDFERLSDHHAMEVTFCAG